MSNTAPLSVASSGRYLVDSSGAPFFWMGDTLWHLFRSYSLPDVREILAARKRQGFSVLLVMLLGYESDPQPNINGDLPWIDADPSRPNEPYWAHVDAAMRIECEMDFIQVLGIYHKTQARLYSQPRALASARWIASRYREVPHIIWSMYPEARRGYLPIVQSLVDGLRQGDGGAHMISVHPDPSPQSSSFLHQEPWLAINMLQTWNEIEYVYPMTAADYAMTPPKPAIMAEGGYECANNRRAITALDIRRQAYWTYLAGGHLVHGHDNNWLAPATWRNWIDSPGSKYLGVYRKIITSLARWWEVIPNQSIIASGWGEGVHLNASAHSRRGDWALVYFSSRCTARIRMDRIKSTDLVEASWINPADGQRLPIGQFAYADVREFTVPAQWDDALLLLA